ncbi:MAG: response regulator [Pseudomonadota bacterium]
MAKRILIADDNEINREFLRAVLRRDQWRIETVDNGREAIECCRAARYDLVLMDIRMPEVDGIAATAEIRTIDGYDGVPILALTADLHLQQQDELRSRGFAATLLKPISRQALLTAIGNFLDVEPESASPPSDAGPAPIDRQAALAAAGGNTELVDRLTGMLAQELEDFAPRIAEHIAQAALPAARELVHKLRASAGYCGAISLRDAAGELENALSAGDSQAVAAAHRGFDRELERLLASLR